MLLDVAKLGVPLDPAYREISTEANPRLSTLKAAKDTEGWVRR